MEGPKHLSPFICRLENGMHSAPCVEASKVSLRMGVCFLFQGFCDPFGSPLHILHIITQTRDHVFHIPMEISLSSFLPFCLEAMESITPSVVCLHSDPNKMFIGGRKRDYPAEPAERNKEWIISVFLSFPLLSTIAYCGTYLI